MNRLGSILALLLGAAALVLAGCASPILSLSDNEVSFDGSGHVKSALTYASYGSSVHAVTFSTDGTYEEVTKSYDSSSSSWKQSSGDKGTYSYDTKTRTLTVNFTDTWTGGIGGSYSTLTTSSSAPKTTSYLALFGSSNMYEYVMTGSSGSYSTTMTQTNWDGSSMKMNMSISIASDLSTLGYTSETETYDANNNVTYGNKSAGTYTVDQIFPSGIKTLNDCKGKTVTYTYLKSVSTPYTWSSGTTFTAGTAQTTNSAGSSSVMVANDLSWVAQINYELQRSLEGK